MALCYCIPLQKCKFVLKPSGHSAFLKYDIQPGQLEPPEEPRVRVLPLCPAEIKGMGWTSVVYFCKYRGRPHHTVWAGWPDLEA